MSYQIGETFIRRSVNAPDGTFRQRVAWAEATGPGNVCRVVEADRVYVRFTGIGRHERQTNTEFDREWEKP